MVRVLALVEGQTERNFCQQVLAPHLISANVELHPRIITRRGHKGGVGRWDNAKREILGLIRQGRTRDSAVTTMFDLYGLPESWPGREEANRKGLKYIDAVTSVEAAIGDAIRAEFSGGGRVPRFAPYLSLHEYEALLFSDPAVPANVTGGAGDASAFQAVLDECGRCERINDHRDTAPSKRILKIAPAYDKTTDGIIAAERITLAVIRQQCPHFASWLDQLEQLGRPG